MSMCCMPFFFQACNKVEIEAIIAKLIFMPCMLRYYYILLPPSQFRTHIRFG
jgi:hypothetical protein